MRGKPANTASFMLTVRIIPARAGQTIGCGSSVPARPDHPRACGANEHGQADGHPHVGSSPRVRGKPLDAGLPFQLVRIIPARAGQTNMDRQMATLMSDHPRACGANLLPTRTMPFASGSSPRVRGKPVVETIHVDLPRIIPARAGQTPSPVSARTSRTDHPRACGANGQIKVHFNDSFGSSPRVRGKLALEPIPDRRDRIIPARAGQTVSVSWTGVASTDHPRACGANSPILCENS